MNNMTEGPIIKKTVLFSLPLIIGNLFQLFYNMVDTFIVGRTLGLEALAGVGVSGSLTFFILGFAQGFTSGTAIPLAQAFGAGDYRKVKRSVAINIMLACAVTGVLTLASTYFLGDILRLIRTPEEIIGYAYDYIFIIFAGMIVTILFNMLSNILRAIGDSRTPVVALIVTTVVNIILDYVLIIYFKMGVKGAAYATVIAQVVAIMICLYVIYKGIYVLQVEKEDFKLVGDELALHCKLGFPMGFQMSIIAIGSVSVSMALNTLGPNAVAGYSAAIKIDLLVEQIMASLGLAAATFVAQNFGAKKYDRLLTGVKKLVSLNILISWVAGLIVFFVGGQLTAIFGDQAVSNTLYEYGSTFFHIMGPSFWLLAILFVLRYSLQGMNDSLFPTLAGIGELVMRVLAAFFLTPRMGFAGAVLANPMAWIGSVAFLIPAFLMHQKKLKAIMNATQDPASMVE